MCTIEVNTGTIAESGTILAHCHYLLQSVPSDFDRHYSVQPALLNRHHRGSSTTVCRTRLLYIELDFRPYIELDYRSIPITFFFFSIPFVTLALLSRSLPVTSSDPGSHSGPYSPLPTTVRAFIFIARMIQHFLPSLTRVTAAHQISNKYVCTRFSYGKCLGEWRKNEIQESNI